ncbi:MAG: hypothetical protein A2X22_13185 [Bacteroidetes bacterium GWF2_49_14]|nr:MAG: hypothetical protein A2X22_13185 [Bacteroidetes bacterium GWF2_49_14]
MTSSCHSQTNTQNTKTERQSQPKDSQIDEYVVEIFEDSKGNLWFGTINKGAARYDGKALTYFTTEDGMSGNTVTSFAEDKEGNIWFGTHSGLSKYDGKAFTRFTTAEGLVNNTVSELLIDKKGILWVGTWGGVSRLEGTTFSTFTLPIPDVTLLQYQLTMKDWITEIIEDKQGNIWFSQGGRTGDGGLSRFDGKTFTRFDKTKGLSKNDIYAINEDNNGNIWIGANGLGAYCYDGKDLMTFGYGIQDILEDKKGNLWLGLSGGLFRLKGNSITNVSQNGPWN